jgi:dipeptidyl aminopeptidase/acylaminoacyl peptidase
MGCGRIARTIELTNPKLALGPIQEGEEFFTALLRQVKRTRFVRYAGEGHTINNCANVLDMWKRIAAWLADTMPAQN